MGNNQKQKEKKTNKNISLSGMREKIPYELSPVVRHNRSTIQNLMDHLGVPQLHGLQLYAV